MKKIGALFLAMIMAAGLVGCSNNGNGENDEQTVESEPLNESEIKQMYTDPNAFKGRTIEIGGQVFYSPEYDNNGVNFQMFSDPQDINTNIVVKYADPDFSIASDDFVKIIGVVKGSFTGTNLFGGKVSAPVIEAESVEISTYQDAVAPAIYTMTLDEPTQTQYGYSVTIEKVDIAKNETRVYVKVENGGTANFSIYSFTAKIVQNGKQFDIGYNLYADYPDVQSNLSVGVTTEGILCFPVIENSDFQIVLDGYSDNWKESIEPYTFEFVSK